MGIGLSVLLLAAGAVLAFAIDLDNSGVFDLNAIGVILMVVGAIGLVWTAMVWGPRSRTRIVEDEPVERRTVIR